MNNSKNTIRNIAGFTLSAGLAYTTGILPQTFITSLIGSISKDFTFDYIKNGSLKRIQKLLVHTHPSELNHDLERLIIKSVEWSIKNIEYLYVHRNFLKSYQKQRLKKFTTKLINELNSSKNKINAISEKVYQKIEENDGPKKLLEDFKINPDSFPEVKHSEHFGVFFNEQFPEMFKLCFGELLKEEDNRKALIAYEREVNKRIEIKLDDILNRLDITHAESQVSVIDKASVKEVKKKLANCNIVDFERVINEQYSTISKDLKGLKVSFYFILDKLEESYFSKNKVYILSSFAVLVLIISTLGYYIYVLPFNTNVNIQPKTSLKLHLQYPNLEEGNRPKLVFYLDSKKEAEELTNKGITLSELPAKYKGKKVKIELIDEYWKLSIDSMILKRGSIQIPIEPNESLAKIVGRVFKHIGHQPVSGALIKMVNEGLETKTDSIGIFRIYVPIEYRRKQYDVRVLAENFDSTTITVYPGNEKQIGLFEAN